MNPEPISQSPSEIESSSTVSSWSEDETPTISDEEFIVSDSEMEEAEQAESEEGNLGNLRGIERKPAKRSKAKRCFEIMNMNDKHSYSLMRPADFSEFFQRNFQIFFSGKIFSKIFRQNFFPQNFQRKNFSAEFFSPEFSAEKFFRQNFFPQNFQRKKFFQKFFGRIFFPQNFQRKNFFKNFSAEFFSPEFFHQIFSRIFSAEFLDFF